METQAHRRLKRIAAAWLLREGFVAVAEEVRTPIFRFRADVAGYTDRAPWPDGRAPDAPADRSQRLLAFPTPAKRERIEPRTVVVECKQARSDFLRERHDLERLLTLRDRLRVRVERFEDDHIKRAEPGLRRSGRFLFREMEGWDFHRSGSSEYRRLVARAERVERLLHGSTKLFRLGRHAVADRLFVLAPRGVVRPRELPPGWGLLECPPAALRRATAPESVGLTLARPAEDRAGRPEMRARLLRQIAVASTRAALGGLDAAPATA